MAAKQVSPRLAGVSAVTAQHRLSPANIAAAFLLRFLDPAILQGNSRPAKRVPCKDSPDVHQPTGARTKVAVAARTGSASRRVPGEYRRTPSADISERCPLCCPLLPTKCGRAAGESRQIAPSINEIVSWMPFFRCCISWLVSVRSEVQLLPGPLPMQFPPRIIRRRELLL
jgi:hypothetical protein